MSGLHLFFSRVLFLASAPSSLCLWVKCLRWLWGDPEWLPLASNATMGEGGGDDGIVIPQPRGKPSASLTSPVASYTGGGPSSGDGRLTMSHSTCSTVGQALLESASSCFSSIFLLVNLTTKTTRIANAPWAFARRQAPCALAQWGYRLIL